MQVSDSAVQHWLSVGYSVLLWQYRSHSGALQQLRVCLPCAAHAQSKGYVIGLSVKNLFICPYTKPWVSASTCLWRLKSYSSIHHRNSSLPGQPKKARSCCLARKSWFFCKVQRSSGCLALRRPFTEFCGIKGRHKVRLASCCHGSLIMHRGPRLIQAGSVKVLYISSLAMTQCQSASSSESNKLIVQVAQLHLHGKYE